MEELIDLALKNPFILILIIGALFSLFKGKPKTNTEDSPKQQHQQREQKVEAPQEMSSQTQPNQARGQTSEAKQNEQALDHASIEEERAFQMKQLKAQITSPQHQSLKYDERIADKRREVEVQKLHDTFEQKEFKRKIKNGLTNKGLLSNIVMSEILGSPRALKPYKSVITQRREK